MLNLTLSVHSFFYTTPALLICLFVALMMLATYRWGIYFKRKYLKKYTESDGLGPIEGSMLGLLALILAFTFGMAGDKYNTRRSIIIDEANCISTAILRTDLYPDSIRSEFRSYFRDYLEARISYYNDGINEEAVDSMLALTQIHFNKIWKLAIREVIADNSERTTQIIPALNEMNDITTKRDMARISTIPESIWFLLFILTLSASFISGYGSKTGKVDWVLVVGFVLMTAMTIFIILDLDRPRRGIITLANANNRIVDLRGMLK